MVAELDQLRVELDRLVERVRPWTFDRWAARATGRDGTRGDAVYELVVAMAAAAPSTPPGVTPSRLRDISLVDQLIVIGNELAGLPAETAVVLLAQLRSTRDAIEAPPLA